MQFSAKVVIEGRFGILIFMHLKLGQIVVNFIVHPSLCVIFSAELSMPFECKFDYYSNVM